MPAPKKPEFEAAPEGGEQPKNAKERDRIGPRGEPIGSKGTSDGLTGSGHGTADPKTGVRSGRGSWIPSQGSAGEGMPAQKPGRAKEPQEREAAAPETSPPPSGTDGM
jgi:hypothetical protein